MPTPTVENYVKTLYLEQQRTSGELVGLGKLASAMQVVPGTVTTMVRALSDAGLVRYEPRIGVSLTPAGEKLALHVLRRHRLLEQFLVEVLKFDWSEVHVEAEELEHAVSDKVLDRIDALLGHPTVDPHGDPIPTAAGTIAQTTTQKLSECSPNQIVTIARIDNQNEAFLKYAHEHGLRPGTTISILANDAIAGIITLRHKDGTNNSLSLGAASMIDVSL